MIEQALRATAHLTQVQAGQALGVGQQTVSRWRNGDRKPLREGTRRALEMYLAQQGELPPPEPEAFDPQAEWLADVERVVRLASTKETLDAAERLALKKDILNTYIDARKQRGAPVPPVLYEMLGRVERGEL